MAGLYVDLSYICAHIPSRYTGPGCVGSLSPDNMIAKPLSWTPLHKLLAFFRQ